MDTHVPQLTQAAKAGGDIVRHYFGEVLLTEEKSNAGDLRTKADIESEQAILSILTKAFPTYNIYAEESGPINHDSEYTLVIDPLDGTSNFVLGIPDFAISIGLLKGNEAVCGVIYNPILNQVYSAEKGKGAFLNGTAIHVNQETDIARATIAYSCGYNTSYEYSAHIAKKLHDVHIKRLLDHWAPTYDYCLLASGHIEVVICKDGDLEDYVAAKVIVTEAGGVITGFKRETIDGRTADFIATNGTSLHDVLTM
jgi:myo-inositol-1(or 4)-monophosphatase